MAMMADVAHAQPLSSLLRRVREVVLDDAGHPWHRAYHRIFISRVGLVACTVQATQMLWLTLTSPLQMALRFPLRLFLGSFSCVIAQIVFAFRMHLARAAIEEAALLASTVEGFGDDASRARLRSTARSARSLQRAYNAFIVFTCAFNGINPVLSGAVWTSPLQSAWTVYATTCCVTSYYTLLPTMLVFYAACAALFREAGRQVKGEGGGDSTLRCAVLHARLRAACRLGEDVFGPLFIGYLQLSLTLPMASTVDVIATHGKSDMLAYSTLPLVFVVFVPLCIAGQHLEDASLSASWEVYCSAWPGAPLAAQRRCLMVMLGASWPCQLRVQGLAKLNRPTCAHVVRTWFSYFQMLVNLSGRV